VLRVLRHALEAAVRQLAGHLERLPAELAAREGWVVSLTQPVGEAPITHFPEALQEEVTVAITYYKGLTSTAEEACPDGAGGGGEESAGGEGGEGVGGRLPADITTRPLRVAFFACVGGCTACLSATAERFSLQPAERGGGGGGGEGAEAAGGGGPGTSGGGGGPAAPPRGAARAAVLAMAPDSDDDEPSAAGPGSPRGGAAARPLGGAAAARGGVGVGGVPGVSDDVRLLLTASNLSFIRNRLMASLTQRFLLVLTGAGGRAGGLGGGGPLLLWPAAFVKGC
jgi:hypothetical protein